MHPRTCTLLLTTVLLCGNFARGAEPAGFTVDLNRNWEPMVIEFLNAPPAESVGMEMTDKGPVFLSNHPGALAVFEYRFHVPIDLQVYPILVMKYRAENLDGEADAGGIWIDDSSTGYQLRKAFPLSEFSADGEEHELRFDMRGATLEGTMTRLMVHLVSMPDGQARFEMHSLRLETAPDATDVPELVEDSPITLQIVDALGDPIAGATVIIDAERIEFARSGTTDDNGHVSITPVKSETGVHMAQVEADGMATLFATLQPSEEPIRLELLAGQIYGGIVQNESGEPIEGATVRVFAPFGQDAPRSNALRMVRRVVRLTDAEGRWSTPPLPVSEMGIMTKLAHPDYISDKQYNDTPLPEIEDLEAGTGVQVLRKE